MYAVFYEDNGEIKALGLFKNSVPYTSIPEWIEHGLRDKGEVILSELDEELKEEGFLYYNCDSYTETIPAKLTQLSYDEWCKEKGIETNTKSEFSFFPEHYDDEHYDDWINDKPDDYNTKDYIETHIHHNRNLFILDTNKSFNRNHEHYKVLTKVIRDVKLELLEQDENS